MATLVQEMPEKNHILPKWLRELLVVVSLYNLVAAILILLLPNFFFNWSGVDITGTEEVWTTTGIIAVFLCGGYWLTLRNPMRFWPFGLLGLISSAGGLFYIISLALSKNINPQAAFVFGAFDLMGSVGFVLVLRRIYLHRQETISTGNLSRSVRSVNFLNDFRLNTDQSLGDFSSERPTLLVFLRHFGCTFCREALADIRERRIEIEADGTRVVLVHMVDEQEAKPYLERVGMADVARISDPGKDLYKAFDLKRGNFRQLFGLKSWIEGFRAGILNRHGIGKESGDGFQMPGVFLLHKGRVLKSYRHALAADRPNYTELAQCEVM